MPCRYDEPQISYDSYDKEKREKEKLMEMLCYVMRNLEDNKLTEIVYRDKKALGKSLTIEANILKWWADHKERDRIKAEAEEKALKQKALKAAALKKLTADEKRALGISEI